jgi:hypothetical protein
MPFKKVGQDQYVSPRGNKFTRSQVRLYYAKGGRFPGEGMRESAPPNPLKEMSYGTQYGQKRPPR